MKVYGIYSGCVYEGGNIWSTLHTYKEDAIRTIEEWIAVDNMKKYDNYFNDYPEHYSDYKWKKRKPGDEFYSVISPTWNSSYDEIYVVELELK